jgi:hypothetical protein
VKAEHINIAVIGILLGVELGMVLPRQELHVVTGEVALGLKIIVHELFEYVLFRVAITRKE